MAREIEFIRKDDEPAFCPHCEKELDKVFYKAKGFAVWTGRHNMYICPHCKKVIGFSQSRMGW